MTFLRFVLIQASGAFGVVPSTQTSIDIVPSQNTRIVLDNGEIVGDIDGPESANGKLLQQEEDAASVLGRPSSQSFVETLKK